MKRSIHIVFCAFLVCLCATAIAAAPKTVRVGVYDNKPIIFMDDSGPKGLFIDVLEDIAGKENWTLEYHHDTWKNIFNRLLNNDIDLLPAVAFIASRLPQIDYGKETLVSNWGQVYTRKNLAMESIQDLTGKKIATLSRDTHGDYFKTLLTQLDVPFDHVIIETYVDIFRALESGKCDAGVVNYLAAKVYSNTFNVQATPIVFNPIKIRYAVPNGDPAGLLPALDKHVSAFKTDDHSYYQTIMTKWLGVAPPVQNRFPAWMKWALVVSLGVVVLLFTGNRILKAQVKTRTSALMKELNHRKTAEENLKEKELRFHGIVDSMADWVWEVDAQGKYTYCSEKIVHILGYRPDQVVGKTPFDFIASDDREKIRKKFLKLVTANRPIKDLENWNVSRDGRRVCLLTNGVPILDKNGDLLGYRGVDTDITARKQARERLRKSEEKFRLAFRTSPDAIILTSIEEGEYIDINEGFTKIMGYSRRQAIGKSLSELNIWKDPKDRDRLISGLKEQGIVENMEAVFTTRQGQLKSGLISARLLKIENNNFILSIIRDITRRKQMEADRERLLTAIEQVAEGIVITDTHGTIEYVNPAFEKITGYSLQDLIGQDPKVLKSGRHTPLFYHQMWKTITSGKTWNGRLFNKKKNGRVYTEDATISPVFDKSGNIINFVAVKRDISEEIRAEERLQQSRKMEAIGTLAGGIAHDFNNILFPIVGHAEMLLEDIPKDSPFQDSLNDMYTSALRARDLVQQILAFSRQEKTEQRQIKIQPIIKEALKLIRSSIPATIQIHQDIQADCDEVKADPTQIHQIIMNLATNAYHAMEENGGTLKVRLGQTRLDPDESIPLAGIPGQYACLTVSDTGVGMTNEVKNKIFEPFFTTQKNGKGTGMGLSVIHGIVMEMNGAIRVNSSPGHGTDFQVYLPVIKALSQTPVVWPENPIQGGTERILLVDDEDGIITMEKRMLNRLGYRVTSCTSSLGALGMFKADPYAFDLVITDMTMPNMPGDKLAVEFMKIRPDIPILLCTGFSETMSEKKIHALGIRGLLLKPILIKDLARKIRKILTVAQ